MNFIPTQINGCYTLESEFIKDKRGYFMISFKENTLKKGVHQHVHFVQNYQCFSTIGVLRGVHCQTEIHTQENKLICDKNLILRALENEKKIW